MPCRSAKPRGGHPPQFFLRGLFSKVDCDEIPTSNDLSQLAGISSQPTSLAHPGLPEFNPSLQEQAILKQGLANGDSTAQIFVALTKFIASQPQSHLQEMDRFGK